MTCSMNLAAIKIKHIRAKPSALSQNQSRLLARMRRCIRVILRARLAQLISYSRPCLAHLGAGRGSEYEFRKYELACMSREAPRFLALKPVSLSTTAAYSFVFAVLRSIKVASIRKLVLSTATKMA